MFEFFNCSEEEASRFVLQFSVGDLVLGKIVNFLHPLLVVDIGGPLLAIVDPLGWPKDVLYNDIAGLVGESREFVVVMAEPADDSGSPRIYLSMKEEVFDIRERWNKFVERARVGDVVSGRISFVNEKGASVDVDSFNCIWRTDSECCKKRGGYEIPSNVSHGTVGKFEICGFEDRTLTVLLCLCEPLQKVDV